MRVLSAFSRRFALADLGADDLTVEISADAEERAAIALRFDLLALDALAATARLRRVGGGRVGLNAHFTAEVVQRCVVTLEPVGGRIEDDIAILFAPAEVKRKEGGEQAEVVVAAEGEDAPEPLVGDAIDIGEAIVEHLGLALDPYPRRPGVVFPAADTQPKTPAADAPDSPFSVLRDLKPKS